MRAHLEIRPCVVGDSIMERHDRSQVSFFCGEEGRLVQIQQKGDRRQSSAQIFAQYWPTGSKCQTLQIPTGTTRTKRHIEAVMPHQDERGRKNSIVTYKTLKYRLCHCLALILFLPSSWGGSREGKISMLLPCFSTNCCHTASRERTQGSSFWRQFCPNALLAASQCQSRLVSGFLRNKFLSALAACSRCLSVVTFG